MFRIILAALVLLIPSSLVPSLVYAVDGELSVVFVPKPAYRDTYIALELVSPALEASPRAKATMWVLRNALADAVSPYQGSEVLEPARCTVEVRQLEDTDPTYWLSCYSAVPTGEERLVQYVGHFDDSTSVLKAIREFSRKHFERTRRSILRRVKGPLQTT